MNKWIERRSGSATTRPKDHRDPYQRDKARILHSAAFRTLQAKTQILGVGQHDFYRTRLTHSLEVAQIGSGLLAQLHSLDEIQNNKELRELLPSEALVESLCLAHDIGHPPFGHGGEVALNYVMRDHGGFEANGQTFRIISKLEPYTQDFGMDLTRRTILGLVKYPIFIEKNKNSEIDCQTQNSILKASQWKPTKGLFQDDSPVFTWLTSSLTNHDQALFSTHESAKEQNGYFSKIKSKYKSLDASIMELADDIAYAVHDFEDAIVMENVTKELWYEEVLPKLKAINNSWAIKHAEHLSEMLFSIEHYQRKNAIGALVNHLITNIEFSEIENRFEEPLLKYNAQLNQTAEPILSLLKSFVYEHVIQANDIQQLEFKGQRMLLLMFDAFNTDPKRLLPPAIYRLWHQAHQNTQTEHRVICDYLSSMSDEQARRQFQSLFGNHI